VIHYSDSLHTLKHRCRDQQLDEEYEYLLTDYPEMPSLWQAYFDDRIDIKSLEEQLELYKNAIRDTQGSRRLIKSEFQSIYKTKDCGILVRFSKMLLERGYSERVFSIWSLINRLKYEYKEEDGSWREWARRNTVTLEVPDEWLAAEDSVLDDETITPDLRWFRLEFLREYRDWCAEGADRKPYISSWWYTAYFGQFKIWMMLIVLFRSTVTSLLI